MLVKVDACWGSYSIACWSSFRSAMVQCPHSCLYMYNVAISKFKKTQKVHPWSQIFLNSALGNFSCWLTYICSSCHSNQSDRCLRIGCSWGVASLSKPHLSLSHKYICLSFAYKHTHTNLVVWKILLDCTASLFLFSFSFLKSLNRLLYCLLVRMFYVHLLRQIITVD